MSKLIETRAEFQALAETRLEEAKALLDAGKWDGAYYLAGYAVEFALKACVIRCWMNTDAFPPDRKFSERCYTHEIETLVKLARLSDSLKVAINLDSTLGQYWLIVKDWSEEKRYHRMNQGEAEALYNAVADIGHGVFQC